MNKIFWNPNPAKYKSKLIKGIVCVYDLFIILLIGKTIEESNFSEIIFTVSFVIIFLNLIPFQIYRLIIYISKK